MLLFGEAKGGVKCDYFSNSRTGDAKCLFVDVTVVAFCLYPKPAVNCSNRQREQREKER